MRVHTLRLLVPLLVACLTPAAARSQTTESRASGSVDVAIVVNTGEGSIADIRHGLAEFFDAIRAPHEMALAGLARPTVRVDYTPREDVFTHGVNTLQLRGANGANVSIKEAAVAASREMQARGASRRVIVAVSDGTYQGATGNNRNKSGTPDDLQTALQAAGVTFYQVVITSSQPPVLYPGGSYYIKPPVAVSDVAPKASGGRVVYVLASSGVPAALAGIASDINQ